MRWDAVPKKIGIVKYDRKKRAGWLGYSAAHGYVITDLDRATKKDGAYLVLAWDDGTLFFTWYDKEFPNPATVVFPTIASAKKYLDATYASSPPAWPLPHDFTTCLIGYHRVQNPKKKKVF
jgi:hypothetical protein